MRAVGDDGNNCWRFSATDVVRAINDEPDYTKAGNYWRWLKRKLKQDGVQFVSGTHKLKIVATDGKQYNSDALSAEDIVLLANESAWLTADQMAELFQRDRSTIQRHVKRIYEEGELKPNSTCALFADVVTAGRKLNREKDIHSFLHSP